MRSVIGLVALAVFVLGTLALLAAWAAGALPPSFLEQPIYIWTAAIVLGGALGLFLLLNSGFSVSPRARPFIFDRGTTRRGRLQINAGAVDFNVSAHAADMSEILAGGQAAGGHTPRVRLDGGDAIISFPRRPVPLAGASASDVTLTPNVPWVVEASSGLGELELDLFELSVPELAVRSGWGDVRLVAPAAGITSAKVTTWLGDARIEVPSGVAVQISAKGGRFAEVKVDEHRWPGGSNGSWISPDFESNPHRLTLNLATTFGNISVA
jgi:hypothetical protein